jgi:hypothetical protein
MAAAQITDDRGKLLVGRPMQKLGRHRVYLDHRGCSRPWRIRPEQIHKVVTSIRARRVLADPFAISRGNGIHSTRPDLPRLTRNRRERKSADDDH